VDTNDYQHDDFDPNAGAGPDVESEQAITAPIGTGGFDGAPSHDPFASATTQKRVTGGAMLIIAVIAIAAGGLFIMNKLARATAAHMTDTTIEETIESFLKAIQAEGDPSDVDLENLKTGDGAVLAVLDDQAYLERQVPLQDVQKDPFIIFEQAPDIVDPVVVSVDDLTQRQVEEFNRRRADREMEFDRASQSLTLKSVMGGSTPMAMINGKILRVGESIAIRTTDGETTFTVTEIAGDTVALEAAAPELDLTMTYTIQIAGR
jgi:hypothetical protein